jgi:hypothetical protein
MSVSLEIARAVQMDGSNLKSRELLVSVSGYPSCKGNLTDLRRILHLSLAKGNLK